MMSYSKELILEVAELYYENNLKQDSIARRLKISRFKVSRVLKRAREDNLVKIQVVKSNYNNEDI